MKVSKRFFSPSPKVDSAIISIKNISNKYFNNKNDEELFFKLIKASFAHKRKVLRKNLEELGFTLEKIDGVFRNLNIDQKIRAEDIKFEKWIEINSFIKK